MKQTLLLTAVALTASVSAFAAEPYVGSALPAPVPAKEAPILFRDAAAMKISHINDGNFSVLRSMNTGTHEIGCTYSMPSGTFFSGLYSYGGKEYYSGAALLPSCHPVTFSSIVLARPVGENDRFNDFENVSLKWDYYDTYNYNDITDRTSTSQNINMVFPCDVQVGFMRPPVLSIDYYSQVDTCRMYPVIPGGKPFFFDQEDKYCSVDALLYPSGFYSSLASMRLCQAAICGSASAGDGLTFNDISSAPYEFIYADAFQREFGEELRNARIQQFYFQLGYSDVPYALSKLTFGFNYMAPQASNLQFTLFRMDGTEITDEILYNYIVKIPAAANEVEYTAEIPFTSVDEWGEELSYMMIDGPVFVLVSGLEQFPVIGPHCLGYDYNDFRTYGVTCTSGCFVQMNGDTKSLDGVVCPLETLVWTLDNGTDITYKSYDVGLEVEYPYLEASRYNINGTESYFEYQSNGSYAVDLAEGENEVAVFMATSAEYADELFIDDSELPSWLSYSVEDYFQVYNEMNSFQRAAVLTFNVTDGQYAEREGHMTIEYKGRTITLYVGQGGAANKVGIKDVEAAENGAAEYFDLQGRKLQAAPANGFFLQREGNKVTKVIR